MPKLPLSSQTPFKQQLCHWEYLHDIHALALSTGDAAATGDGHPIIVVVTNRSFFIAGMSLPSRL